MSQCIFMGCFLLFSTSTVTIAQNTNSNSVKNKNNTNHQLGTQFISIQGGVNYTYPQRGSYHYEQGYEVGPSTTKKNCGNSDVCLSYEVTPHSRVNKQLFIAFHQLLHPDHHIYLQVGIEYKIREQKYKLVGQTDYFNTFLFKGVAHKIVQWHYINPRLTIDHYIPLASKLYLRNGVGLFNDILMIEQYRLHFNGTGGGESKDPNNIRDINKTFNQKNKAIAEEFYPHLTFTLGLHYRITDRWCLGASLYTTIFNLFNNYPHYFSSYGGPIEFHKYDFRFFAFNLSLNYKLK